MEKGESKKGMGCWAILTISVGMFIFWWYIYPIIPFEVKTYYIGWIESDKEIEKIIWRDELIEDEVSMLLRLGDDKDKSYRIQKLLEKLRKVDSNKYKLLVVYGSRIKRIKKSMDNICTFDVLEFERNIPENKIHYYLIDRRIPAISPEFWGIRIIDYSTKISLLNVIVQNVVDIYYGQSIRLLNNKYYQQYIK